MDLSDVEVCVRHALLRILNRTFLLQRHLLLDGIIDIRATDCYLGKPSLKPLYFEILCVSEKLTKTVFLTR